MTRVLVLNCGSSSLKHALFDLAPGREELLARGSVDRIDPGKSGHADAAAQLVARLEAEHRLPDAVGHRVVHGGREHTPRRIDASTLAQLEQLIPFAPLHLPAELAVIRAILTRWPTRLQVACFDTAFHWSMSQVARRYALPESVVAGGIERYGFHGLSYEYVVDTLGPERIGRAVVAHLGSGASMAAIAHGRSVDTTMGFSPSGGLVMGTRPGDLDPGLLLYLMEHGYGARELEQLINHRSGLAGLSGGSSDMRDLLARRASDPHAALAIEVFVWSARKAVGALSASLGGLDSLVFTGGIGEHAAAVRAEIAAGLSYLGVQIDPERNARVDSAPIEGTQERVAPREIGAAGAGCSGWVVFTDEERMIARRTFEMFQGVSQAG